MFWYRPCFEVHSVITWVALLAVINQVETGLNMITILHETIRAFFVDLKRTAIFGDRKDLEASESYLGR